MHVLDSFRTEMRGNEVREEENATKIPDLTRSRQSSPNPPLDWGLVHVSPQLLFSILPFNVKLKQSPACLCEHAAKRYPE